MYEKDYLMPKLCMTRTINLSNTQFRYQLVFFVHIYGYIWLAEGCLWHLLPRQNLRWHLLPRQNLPSASFAQAKHARWYVLPGCMICLIQRVQQCFGVPLVRTHGHGQHDTYTYCTSGITQTKCSPLSFCWW